MGVCEDEVCVVLVAAKLQSYRIYDDIVIYVDVVIYADVVILPTSLYFSL